MAQGTPPAGSLPRLGRYGLIKEIAGSGVATTWIARVGDDATRLCTILRLHRHITKKVELAEAFLNEARHAQKLKHTNVLQVLETGIADGEVFVVTEYLESDTLAALFANAGPEGLPIPVVLRIALDVLDGLSAAHTMENPLVHGEVSPFHVRIGLDGVARLGAYGVARALARLGTHGIKNHDRLSYGAPERVKAMAVAMSNPTAGPLDPRCDVFSVAVMLWECIVRQRLFTSKIEAAVIQKVLTAPIAPLSSFKHVDVPQELEEAVMKGLERDPERRHASAEDFIMALEGVGPSGIASHEKVAAALEKLAGKAIATRRSDVEAILAGRPDVSSRPPPAPRARNLTLIGTGPDAVSTDDEAPAAADGSKEPATEPAAAPASDATKEPPKRKKEAPAVPAPVGSSGLPMLFEEESTSDADSPTELYQRPRPRPRSRPRTATLLGMPGQLDAIEGEDGEDVADEVDDAAPRKPPPAAGAKPAVAATTEKTEPAKPDAPKVESAPKADALDVDAPKREEAANVDESLSKSPDPVSGDAPATDDVQAKPAGDEKPNGDTTAEPAAAKPPSDGTQTPAAPPPREITPSPLAATPDPGLAIGPPDRPVPAPTPRAATTPREPKPFTKPLPRPPSRPDVTPVPRATTTNGRGSRPDAPGAPARKDLPKPPARTPTATRLEALRKPELPPKVPKPPPPVAEARGPLRGQPPVSDSRGPLRGQAPARPDANKPKDLPKPPPPPPHTLRGSKPEWIRRDSVKPLGPVGAALDQIGPGTVLGRYEILAPIAKGGMAIVWAARLSGSRGFQKIVAVKTMLPDVSDDPDFEKMFLDEARVAARIRHPNVAEILDLGEEKSVLYLVMEWVDGDTVGLLQKMARPSGGIPLGIILRMASQICAGLHAAHELRDDAGAPLEVVHRDMSPANVLVAKNGFVKIVDFGIAKSRGRLHVTRVGSTVKGKTPYLSPEQLAGKSIDRRSDIFSLGALLYVLATGLHPFRGETDIKTIENIASKDAAPLRDINPNINPEFEQIVLKALAKSPANRYATAADMQRAIDQLAQSLDKPATDEEVSAFVTKTIGEVLTKREADLAAALGALEKGADGGSEITDDISVDDAPDSDDAAVLAAPAAVEAKSASAATTPMAAPKVQHIETSPAVASGGEEAASDELVAPVDSAKRKRIQLVVLGVLAAAVALGVFALAGGGGESPTPTTPSSRVTDVVPAAPSAAPTAEATAAPSATPTAVASAEPSATAAPEPPPTPTAEPAAPPPEPADTAKNTPAPAAKPKAAVAPAPKPRAAPAPKPTPPPAPAPAPKPTTKKKFNPTGI